MSRRLSRDQQSAIPEPSIYWTCQILFVVLLVHLPDHESPRVDYLISLHMIPSSPPSLLPFEA